MTTDERVTGVVLAGGRGRRMGGQDKGLVEFRGRALIEWVLEALDPQVDALLINANRNQARYAAYGYPVVMDELADYQGPLAGFAAALRAAPTELLLTVPCDGPLLPADLVQRLRTAMERGEADIAVAHDGRRMQPVYALLRVSLLPSLESFLAAGERKIDRWYERHVCASVDFSDRPETFANVNSAEERAALEAGTG